MLEKDMLDVLPRNSVEFQDSALEYWLKFFITDKIKCSQ